MKTILIALTIPWLAFGVTISAVAVNHVSETTGAITWTTDTSATTGLACSTTQGSFTKAAVDDSSATVTSHYDAMAGLVASTHYYCQITSGAATALVEFTTSQVKPTYRVMATSVSAATKYNTTWFPTHWTDGDSEYNTTCGNGATRGLLDDNHWPDGTRSGVSYTSVGSNAMIMGISAANPFVLSDINHLSSMGEFTQAGADGMTQKGFGLVCLNDFWNTDALYMTGSRQRHDDAFQHPLHLNGGIWKSLDYGVTWANWQAPSTFNADGSMVSPVTANFFGANNPQVSNGGGRFSVITPVQYSAGNNASVPLVDQQDVFAYFMAGGMTSLDSQYANGDDTCVLRVPRSKIGAMVGTDWQAYVGGTFSDDASWSGTFASCVSVNSKPGQMGWENLTWLPTVNRYLMTTSYYDQGIATTNSTIWKYYEAAHPSGPWTLVYTSSQFSPQGFFGTIPLQSTVVCDTTCRIRVIFSGDYGTASITASDLTNPAGYYTAFWADVTLRTAGLFPQTAVVGASR